jgi:hypothetical protein
MKVEELWFTGTLYGFCEISQLRGGKKAANATIQGLRHSVRLYEW